jgi:Arc/MetJ-type ribon-helix-helix transcriptional regulator
MTSNNNIYKIKKYSLFMANELVSIRMSKELLQEATIIVKQEGFSNIQEFFRQSVRESILERKRTKALLELKELYGSAKGKDKIATKKELDALARKLFS